MSWAALGSPSILMTAMVAEKKLHIETDHMKSEGGLELDDYKKLTTAVQVEAGIDDREFQFHPARNLHYPLNWKARYTSLTKKRPETGYLDLNHLGLLCLNR